MARDPVLATPRGKMSRKDKTAVLERSEGLCAHPDCAVSAPLELDHIIPLELGGADTPENGQYLCPPHHKAKTALDLKMIAKARRIRKREAGTRAFRKPIQSRGFDKRLRKRMNGTVEVRS